MTYWPRGKLEGSSTAIALAGTYLLLFSGKLHFLADVLPILLFGRNCYKDEAWPAGKWL